MNTLTSQCLKNCINVTWLMKGSPASRGVFIIGAEWNSFCPQKKSICSQGFLSIKATVINSREMGHTVSQSAITPPRSGEIPPGAGSLPQTLTRRGDIRLTRLTEKIILDSRSLQTHIQGHFEAYRGSCKHSYLHLDTRLHTHTQIVDFSC